MPRRKRFRQPETRARLKSYRVTILPTFGPVEGQAEGPEEAEELANHYWDMGWDGDFVTEVEEINSMAPGKR